MDLDAAIHQPRIDASEGAIVIGDVRLPAPCAERLRARFDYEEARIQTLPMKFACPSVACARAPPIAAPPKAPSPGATRWRKAEGDRGWRWLARSHAGHCFWPRSSLSSSSRYGPPRALPNPMHFITRPPRSRAIPAPCCAASPTRNNCRPARAAGAFSMRPGAATRRHRQRHRRHVNANDPAPRPVIAWAHGTTGIVPGCAPSVISALRRRSRT